MTATTDFLIADHDALETLNHQFNNADHPRLRQQIFDQTHLELAKHTKAEQEVVYPLVRTHVPDGPAIVEHARKEHSDAAAKAQELALLTANHPTFATKYAQLMAAVMHHAGEEENNMFHLIDRHFPAKIHDEVVADLKRVKQGVIQP